MWDGKFKPTRMVKHRDYKHSDWLTHELANGGQYRFTVDAPVMVMADPVDESPFEPSRLYYKVEFQTHSGTSYTYLVPAESDNSAPNFTRIRNTIQQYTDNPVFGGRVLEDYIDPDPYVKVPKVPNFTTDWQGRAVIAAEQANKDS